MKRVLKEGEATSDAQPQQTLKRKSSFSSDSPNKKKRKLPRRSRLWTPDQDARLKEIVHELGMEHVKTQDFWDRVALHCEHDARLCRHRWNNFLRPDLRKGDWTLQEEALIVDMHRQFGPCWRVMVQCFPNRTDNDLKNKWNSMRRSQERKARLKAMEQGCGQK